jgi:hypothetical protein
LRRRSRGLRRGRGRLGWRRRRLRRWRRKLSGSGTGRRRGGPRCRVTGCLRIGRRICRLCLLRHRRRHHRRHTVDYHPHVLHVRIDELHGEAGAGRIAGQQHIRALAFGHVESLRVQLIRQRAANAAGHARLVGAREHEHRDFHGVVAVLGSHAEQQLTAGGRLAAGRDVPGPGDRRRILRLRHRRHQQERGRDGQVARKHSLLRQARPGQFRGAHVFVTDRYRSIQVDTVGYSPSTLMLTFCTLASTSSSAKSG